MPNFVKNFYTNWFNNPADSVNRTISWGTKVCGLVRNDCIVIIEWKGHLATIICNDAHRSWASHQSVSSNIARYLSGFGYRRSSRSWSPHLSCRIDQSDQFWEKAITWDVINVPAQTLHTYLSQKTKGNLHFNLIIIFT